MNNAIPSRLSWLGKERDKESGFGDHGVRKYSSSQGRFMSVDPLWEKYLSWTPYQYSMNDPINKRDIDGKAVDIIADAAFIAYDLFDMGRSLYKGEGISNTQVAALGADIVGAMIPFATGGGMAVRVAAHANDMKKVVNFVEGTKYIKNFSESQKLGLKLASDAQMLEKGKPMAGAGATRPINDIKRLIATYGGTVKDWAKKSSSAYKKDGVNVQTHWYENVRTGERVEYK